MQRWTKGDRLRNSNNKLTLEEHLLCTGHCCRHFTHINALHPLNEGMRYDYPHFIGNELSNLSKVTQLIRGGAWI